MAKKPRENHIQWTTGDKEILVEITDRKLTGKIRKFAAEIGAEINVSDGVVSCRLPLENLKFNKKRTVSDEQRAALSEHMKTVRKAKV